MESEGEWEPRRRAFARTLAPRGTVALLAAVWEVSRTLIYQLRSGEKRLVTSRIAALPPPLRERFFHHLAAERRAFARRSRA